MALTIGTRIGSYEIKGPLGEGGMGVVYRASDTKLRRDVAVKLLPENFADHPERLSLFQREAQVLAALNHPNIAQIYGLEESDGARCIVMELVEGETLADRLKRGPIPLREALPIAAQIVTALEAAHEKGIIHRDLKPANVKLTADGAVKVLDFGLAKTIGAESSDPSLSNSPTMLSVLASDAGIILGTAAYMSPEQASGRPVDKRTDLWAFGVVLLEMLTGRQVFSGETVSHIMAAVLMQEPDLAALPPGTPEPIRKLVRRCLEKDRRKRLPDAGAARLEIDEVMQAPAQAVTGILYEPAENKPRFSWLVVGISLVLGIAIGVGALLLVRPHSAPTPGRENDLTRWILSLHPADSLGGNYFYQQRPTRTSIAWSPDGRTLVFGGAHDGVAQLYLRRMDQVDAKPFPSTTGAVAPFFSPDGRWIGFWTNGELQKIPLAGGPAVSIAKVPLIYSASWGEDDAIYFDDGRGNIRGAGISRVSASGGAIESVAAPDVNKGEYSYRLPQLVPGRKALLFTLTTVGPQRGQDSKIVVRSLDGKSQQILADGADPRFIPPGYVVFLRRSALMAAPFDVKELKFTGGAVGVLDMVMQSVPATSDALDSAAGQFSISSNGSLAYVTGGMFDDDVRSVVWVDRTGEVTPLPLPKRRYWGPHLSPDGQRFAVDTRGTETRIWVHDLRTGTTTAISDQNNVATYPIWSPDGKRIVMKLDGAGLFWRLADGSGTVERLSDDLRQDASDWSADGNHLAVVHSGDIVILSQSGGRTSATPWLSTPAIEQYPMWSPDGRWLAYSSNDSGKSEVYVQPYPGPGPRVQISRGGGGSPVWSRDGREIFYAQGNSRGTADIDHPIVSIMAATITLTPTITAGTPHKLFEGPYAITGQARGFDVSPDGKRFLMVLPEEHLPRPATEITIVQNWFEELHRLVAIK